MDQLITLLYDRPSGTWWHDTAFGFSSLVAPLKTQVQLFAGCYAGMGTAKNNVAMQAVHDVGPLPANVYKIAPMIYMRLPIPLGPCMRLDPQDLATMFGRAGFYVHEDNPAHVGRSSDGCIVAQNDRHMIAADKMAIIDRLVAKGENLVRVI